MFWSPSTPVLARTLNRSAPPMSGMPWKKLSSLATHPSDTAPKFPQRFAGPKREEQSRRALPVRR